MEQIEGYTALVHRITCCNIPQDLYVGDIGDYENTLIRINIDRDMKNEDLSYTTRIFI